MFEDFSKLFVLIKHFSWGDLTECRSARNIRVTSDCKNQFLIIPDISSVITVAQESNEFEIHLLKSLQNIGLTLSKKDVIVVKKVWLTEIYIFFPIFSCLSLSYTFWLRL